MEDEMSARVDEVLKRQAEIRESSKGKIPLWEYTSCEDKKVFFEMAPQFESFDKALAWLNQLAGKKNAFFFRGASSDTYKLASSSQRAWSDFQCRFCCQSKRTYGEYLSSLLEFMKAEPGILPNCPGACLCDHQIWGFLQHHGCPSPFIDFSQSPLVALHMAVRGIKPGQRHGISIYATREGASSMTAENDLCDFDWLMSGGTLREFTQYSERQYADKTRFSEWRTLYPIFTMSNKTHPWCPILTRGRMKSQTGLFIYNSSEKETIEQFIKRKRADVDAWGNPNGNTFPLIKCLDLPLRWIPEIKKCLDAANISDETLGLSCMDIEDNVKAALVRFLNAFVS